MAGLVSLLESDLGKQIIGGLSNETGVDQARAAEFTGMAMPLIMGALKKNAKSPEKAGGLLDALNTERHDGRILDDLDGLFQGGVNEEILKDGAGILGHIFGQSTPEMENELSRRSGLNTRDISKMMMTLAPILLGMLGRQKRRNQISNPDQLNTLLASMLGGQPKQNQNLLMSLLDKDGDGSILDDVSDMIVGSGKKQGGLSGLIEGLFG
ncbi:DUF937 domain-containing protein [Robertkochia flava]|uniref:DUF937 domain-containing protein n=1 Tax=Robertkochia flava TaxID=3447986 RepID=UPI001CCBD120|nr:DUF937 domain-containing protein [Robertkochia marina]